jgi:hypothetical protein
MLTARNADSELASIAAFIASGKMKKLAAGQRAIPAGIDPRMTIEDSRTLLDLEYDEDCRYSRIAS